jgi:hypothetical protein
MRIELVTRNRLDESILQTDLYLVQDDIDPLRAMRLLFPIDQWYMQELEGMPARYRERMEGLFDKLHGFDRGSIESVLIAFYRSAYQKLNTTALSNKSAMAMSIGEQFAGIFRSTHYLDVMFDYVVESRPPRKQPNDDRLITAATILGLLTPILGRMMRQFRIMGCDSVLIYSQLALVVAPVLTLTRFQPLEGLLRSYVNTIVMGSRQYMMYDLIIGIYLPMMGGASVLREEFLQTLSESLALFPPELWADFQPKSGSSRH